ncbi:MAG: SAM-dependent methyltransferase, partial [Propionibacteriales bacterium]|nr:SAM-dependent methyltransferase [Propionibacteriales bacterium]
RMLVTRRTYGWVHKYIFPGGLIPSLRAIDANLAQHTRLQVAEQRELGWHYAETLRQWRARFVDGWPQVRDLGFDGTFRRMWEFYLAYCEAGFRTGYLRVQQLSLAPRPTP